MCIQVYILINFLSCGKNVANLVHLRLRLSKEESKYVNTLTSVYSNRLTRLYLSQGRQFVQRQGGVFTLFQCAIFDTLFQNQDRLPDLKVVNHRGIRPYGFRFGVMDLLT